MTPPESGLSTEGSYRPHPDITIRNVKVKDATMTVVLDGQIRHHSAAMLEDFMYQQFCAHQPKALVLDFNKVSFLDSQGLAFLIALYRYCNPQNCQVSILGASPHVDRLLKMTRLNTLIQVV